jgi:hypothetical protein
MDRTENTTYNRVRVTLRLAAYHQAVRLGDKPLETHDQRFVVKLNICGHSPYVTSPLTRGWVCHLQLLLALASAVILRTKSLGTQSHILLSQVRHSPSLEGQVPVFITRRNTVTQLHPQALGSIFFASYDSQGYGGSIRPRLYTGYLQ